MEGRHRAAVAARPDDAAGANALLDAIDRVGLAPDLDAALRHTAAAACALVGASYGVVALVGDDGRETRLVSHGDVPDLGSLPGPRGEAGTGGDLLTAELVAHGATLGRLTAGRQRPFEGHERQLFRRLASLVAPLVANARAFDESERRLAWLEGIIKIGAALAPTMRPKDACDGLVAGVRAVIDSPLVALFQAHGLDGEGWELVAHDGDDAAAAAAASELREQIATAGAGGQLLCVDRSGGLEALLLPVQTQLAPPAVLLVEREGISATIGDLERALLGTFAGQVSLALDRAYAIGERQDRLIAADRDRIARDLHDLVIQRLYATGLQLQAGRAGDASGLDAAVAAAIRDIDTAIRDLRATIFELGRGLDRSLCDEARALVSEYAEVLGFRPTLRFSGPVDTALTEAVGDEALLVLREALSNVARHAGATAVQIELSASPAWFMLRVVDDGVGIGADGGVASGLRNVQRRAECHGGVMRMGSASPRGTSLVWLVPAAR